MAKKSKKTSDDELNEIIDSSNLGLEESCSEEKKEYDDYYDDDYELDAVLPNEVKAITQWMSDGENLFIPTGKTSKNLPPGMYTIIEDPHRGIIFEKIQVKTHGLLKLSGSDSLEVCNEISDFWGKEDIYRKHNISYKRGILLWGPAGSGKSSTLQIVVEDVIKRGGICVVFEDPFSFKRGMRKFRQIQKDTPVVVVMEDIDSIIEECSETEVLNILDGLEKIDKTIFLATTNYPEKLGHRICNRPSRFDRRFKIDYPSKEDRKIYLESINVEKIIDSNKIKKWVSDTENFTFAHLKELFVSVAILGNKYETALEGLKKMQENPSKEGKKSAGFLTEE